MKLVDDTYLVGFFFFWYPGIGLVVDESSRGCVTDYLWIDVSLII